jgi:hypothetical protein
MTLLAPTRPAPTVPGPAATPEPAPARRHAGCYWDHEQAAWVAHTRLPVPRSVQD